MRRLQTTSLQLVWTFLLQKGKHSSEWLPRRESHQGGLGMSTWMRSSPSYPWKKIYHQRSLLAGQNRSLWVGTYSPYEQHDKDTSFKVSFYLCGVPCRVGGLVQWAAWLRRNNRR